MSESMIKLIKLIIICLILMLYSCRSDIKFKEEETIDMLGLVRVYKDTLSMSFPATSYEIVEYDIKQNNDTLYIRVYKARNNKNYPILIPIDSTVRYINTQMKKKVINIDSMRILRQETN